MSKEKDFDAVRMMREIRDKLAREFAGMSYDQQRRYIDEHLKLRVGERRDDHSPENREGARYSSGSRRQKCM